MTHSHVFVLFPFHLVPNGLRQVRGIKAYEFGIHKLQSGNAPCTDMMPMPEQLILVRLGSISQVGARTVGSGFGNVAKFDYCELSGLEYPAKLPSQQIVKPSGLSIVESF